MGNRYAVTDKRYKLVPIDQHTIGQVMACGPIVELIAPCVSLTTISNGTSYIGIIDNSQAHVRVYSQGGLVVNTVPPAGTTHIRNKKYRCMLTDVSALAESSGCTISSIVEEAIRVQNSIIDGGASRLYGEYIQPAYSGIGAPGYNNLLQVNPEKISHVINEIYLHIVRVAGEAKIYIMGIVEPVATNKDRFDLVWDTLADQPMFNIRILYSSDPHRDNIYSRIVTWDLKPI